ncbi:Deoxyadenosine kinase [Lunatimonas lonarensis]|uniref:Deoxyadenosine kinase n=1 Tax=Lunatimonas lonarensis TaxID=1232681 RepID=R7ZQW2_9BACT|nr:deoxynucleoside kinase [Lunatimonas lonarensis]EON76472.1 Deoxyadenosine kinase [Lunatimonas lonarensis]
MHIAVAGNIGCGKTTLTTRLSRHYGWKAEFEPVENNPYLADFYQDMPTWAFHLQVFFLHSRFRQMTRIMQDAGSTVQDRTIYEDAHIFAANLHQNGILTNRDYQNYRSLYDSMIEYITPPDLLIYLRADMGTLVAQIEKRGREFERSIRIDYLKSLNQQYEKWISDYGKSKLLVVDVSKLDFVGRQEDFAYIVEGIDRELYGLFR